MGLIKAALGAASGVMADQWKEFFVCDALPDGVLAVRGQKKRGSRSSNYGDDNIITNGSGIVVADGQCMLIVDNGLVVDYCADPGEYTYDMSTEPSLFDGGKLGANIKAVFQNIGKRFTYGGEAPKDQRVYYFNTKEQFGNKYGTPNPVPFRVVDERAGIDIDINVSCFGEYSIKITNPLLFYTNVCGGNVTSAYTIDRMSGQMRTELLTALQPAFARISAMGIRYSALPGHAEVLGNALNDELSDKWRDLRGIEIVSFGVSSIRASEEDEAMIKELQKAAAFKDPTLGMAYVTGAYGQAMQNAASNAGGAAVGFMGLNVAQGAGTGALNTLAGMAQQQAQQGYQPAQPQAAVQPPAPGAWTCECGTSNTGKFCSNCGKPKPAPAAPAEWTCECGTVNTGNFCSNCGKPRPAAEWTCECGTVNKGRFCSNCGKPRP